ncbi:heavy-metal-associated domain-containing protein [Thiomicrorhabdus aquaedulcis]|uniref:heavy-metal-associated domain-containing protein n=1 Tax=Thiomicrorhabdus aquaedulcis TaxID=2211106 RepID=UPI001562BF31|nr:heavy-metal-associated domain-containing protein [Thiomicrorhabdus aquaedulcis]
MTTQNTLSTQVFTHHKVVEVLVENLKCGGCASHIVKKLSALPNVSDVSVEPTAHAVQFSLSGDSDEGMALTLQHVLQQLTALGYPPEGTLDGMLAVGAKAKSYVSCALGKISPGDKPT